MCEKCKEIDDRIAHLRRLAAQSNDPDLTGRTAQLVKELVAEKIDLHIVRDK